VPRWPGAVVERRADVISGFSGLSELTDQRASRDQANVKAIMDRNGGIGAGFDSLRLWLAFSVLLIHSFTVAQYDQGLPQRLWSGPLRPLLLAILPMFFGLSGFLVTGSAMRTRSIKAFLALRLLRLLPALSVEVTLSALILGPLLTVLPFRLYFSDPLFFSYFGNIVGHVQFSLPGVFASAPMAGIVNLNLWTLRPEYSCYALILFLMPSGALFDRRKMTVIAGIVLAILGVGNSLFDLGETDTMYDAPILLMSFTMGIVAYRWRERIPVHGGVFAAALAALYGAWSFRGTAVLGLIPLTYCMVYLGVQPLPRLKLLPRGDYSYGIYLYGFPIQQALVLLFPSLKIWWGLFPTAALVVLAVAMASWHFVERPALSLKRIVMGGHEGGPSNPSRFSLARILRGYSGVMAKADASAAAIVAEDSSNALRLGTPAIER
jgi:peptidoglycan/LPS O-acetylase OafA/YrhL